MPVMTSDKDEASVDWSLILAAIGGVIGLSLGAYLGFQKEGMIGLAIGSFGGIIVGSIVGYFVLHALLLAAGYLALLLVLSLAIGIVAAMIYFIKLLW
jgi:hypothetical protein